jgi:hypothetical protein
MDTRPAGTAQCPWPCNMAYRFDEAAGTIIVDTADCRATTATTADGSSAGERLVGGGGFTLNQVARYGGRGGNRTMLGPCTLVGPTQLPATPMNVTKLLLTAAAST